MGKFISLFLSLYNSEGIILAIVSILQGVLSLVEDGIIKKFRKKFAVGSLILAILLLANHFNIEKNYQELLPENQVDVPEVTGLPCIEAQSVLRGCYLSEVFFSEEAEALALNNNLKVKRQDPGRGKKLPKYSEVKLFFDDMKASGESHEKLALKITSVEFFSDGYYYKYPDTGSIISFDKGISGTFEYSRELDDKEREHWGHGGKLIGPDGKIIESDGKNPAFWSSKNGQFAVELPEDLMPGTYEYVLYQLIDGQYVSDTVSFNIE